MKNIIKLVLIALFSLSLFSCGNDKIQNPSLMKELQAQVDEVIKQGYQISDIDITTLNFSEHGRDAVGDFSFLSIYGVSPDPKMEYLASFSYPEDSRELIFNGYSDNSHFKSESRANNFTPDLPGALAKLDEIKKQIPEGYKYDNLVSLQYEVNPNSYRYAVLSSEARNSQPQYKFKIELKADNDEITHPKVKREEESHVTLTSYATSRKRTGSVQKKYKKKVDNRVQHTITFKMIGDQIEIE